jgi:hypothetical protein
METIAVGASVVALTPAKYTGKFCEEVLVTVEAGALRYTLNGTTAPNDGTKVGHVAAIGAAFKVTGPDVAKFKFTQSAAAGTINVSYFNNA